jgi:hypothetical protein
MHSGRSIDFGGARARQAGVYGTVNMRAFRRRKTFLFNSSLPTGCMISTRKVLASRRMILGKHTSTVSHPSKLQNNAFYTNDAKTSAYQRLGQNN